MLSPFGDETMIKNKPADCEACTDAHRFCPDHLRAFVGEVATTRDQHTRRMAAYQEAVVRQEAAERRRAADEQLDRRIKRLIPHRPGQRPPGNLGRLLLLAVEAHDETMHAVDLDLSLILGRRA